MVFGLSEKERKVRKVGKFAQDIIIKKAVAREKVKQRILKFEKRKARAIERIRRPPLKVFGKKVRGVAIKAGRRAGKDIEKSLRGLAQKIGKTKEEEKETLVILGGQSRRVKGRVRIVTPTETGLDMSTGLGLNVGLLSEGPKKKRKQLKPIRFF